MKLEVLTSGAVRSLLPAWRSACYQGACRLLWVAAIFLLPLTSLPLLVDISGASTVAPPSNVFFLLMAVVWLTPYSLCRGSLPFESFLVLVFFLIACLSWAAAFFMDIPPFRSFRPLSEGPEVFVTLIMALAVYFVSAGWLSRNPEHFRLSFRLLNWSGLLVIAWSLVQAFFVFYNNSDYPDSLIHFQKNFVARSMPLFYARVTGFSYEPSWLAHQLNMIYLPLWLAATLQRFSVHRRWRLFTLENVLLVLGVVVLFLSFSRVGILSFFLVIAYLALHYNLQLAQRINQRLLARLHIRPSFQKLVKAALLLALLLSFAVVYLGGILGLAYAGSFVEPRLARIFQNPPEAGGLFELTNQLAFAERAIYWATGWEVFNDYPLLGVGPGNTGFFFTEKMPGYGHALWEVSQLFYYLNLMPNTKSMWVRILSETGMVGFAVFLTWLYFLWQAGHLARRSQEPLVRLAGLTGVFVLIAFLIEGFSVDSFALPYFWLSAGLNSAAAFWVRQESRREFNGGLLE